MIALANAKKEDARQLALMSKRAFDSDVAVGAKDQSGPPGYDSENWHVKMIVSGRLSAIVNDGEIVGGLILFDDAGDKAIKYVGRIFIDPGHHKKGYGIEAMKKTEEKYRTVRWWRLETPVWNRRTKGFYEKLGYKEVRQDKESRYFEKEISR